MRFPGPHDVELHPPDTGERKLITPVPEDRLSATDVPERAQVAFKRDSHQMVAIPAKPVSMHSRRNLNRLQVASSVARAVVLAGIIWRHRQNCAGLSTLVRLASPPIGLALQL